MKHRVNHAPHPYSVQAKPWPCKRECVKEATPLQRRKKIEKGKRKSSGDKRAGPIMAHKKRAGNGGSRFQISIEVQDSSVICVNALALFMSLRNFAVCVCYFYILLACMVISE